MKEKNQNIKNELGKVIYLNIAFPISASYLKNNIGHEIINFFADDNGKFNYYLNNNGMVKETPKPDVVFTITYVSTGLYKILNKAIIEDVEPAAKGYTEDSKTPYEMQKEKFKYDDKPLESYFEDNPSGNTILSTYKCEKIFKPEKDLFLKFHTKKSIENSNVINLEFNAPRNANRIINLESNDMKKLEKIADDSDLWKKPIEAFEKYMEKYALKVEKSRKYNYFRRLGIEYQENQFSNAIKFFLEEGDIVDNFVDCLSKIPNNFDNPSNFNKKTKTQNKFYIKREYYDIDLLLLNFDTKEKGKPENEKIIIIENKIKSYITITDEDKSLEDHARKIYESIFDDQDWNLIKQKLNDLDINLENDSEAVSIPNQLSKYYIFAVMMAIKRGWSNEQIKNNIKCFFLCPEYSKINYNYHLVERHLQNNSSIEKEGVFFLQEKYKLITYTDILNIFTLLKKEITNKELKIFFVDFLEALKIHTEDRDDSLEQRMIKMFVERSNRLKETNS